MTDIDKALRDPSSVYHFPREVLEDGSLDDSQKLAILQRWEMDARELLIAEEENMGGDGPSMLSRVHRALAILKGE